MRKPVCFWEKCVRCIFVEIGNLGFWLTIDCWDWSYFFQLKHFELIELKKIIRVPTHFYPISLLPSIQRQSFRLIHFIHKINRNTQIVWYNVNNRLINSFLKLIKWSLKRIGIVELQKSVAICSARYPKKWFKWNLLRYKFILKIGSSLKSFGH